MKRIILHGYLADLYPHPIEVEAETVAEAVNTLSQIKELHRPDGSPHPVYIDGIETDIALYAKTSLEEIHIHPNLGGAGGRGGLGQILIGVAMIAVGLAFPALSLLGGTLTASSLLLAGGMMVLGGILQLMTPMPEDLGDQESSKFLGAAANTVTIGTPIPLAYGNNKLGGHYLSMDIDSKDQAGSDPSFDGTIDGDKGFSLYDWFGTTPPEGSPEGTQTAETTGSFVNLWGGTNFIITNNVVDTGGVVEEFTAPTTPLDDAQVEITDSRYVVYDPQIVPVAPVRPVYADPVASPTNIPEMAWVP